MLVALFNGLKGAMNITNMIDHASIEEMNRQRDDEERKQVAETSALSGITDVLLGEDAHTVQQKTDESKEQEKTSESNEEKNKAKSALSGITDVLLGEDASAVQQEMDESQEKKKNNATNETKKEETPKGNAIMALLKSGAQRVDIDNDYQQDEHQFLEYGQGR